MKIFPKSPSSGLIFFSLFSYITNILWLIIDFLPQFLRQLVFKISFKKYGSGNMIDYKSYVRYPWKVLIGDNVIINRRCELYPSLKTQEGLITLENNVVMGPGVVVFAAGHDYSLLSLPHLSAPVKIGQYAWIGGNTTILPGVTIGEGAIIGAGSVVSKSIPAYCVAVGNPARVIKSRILQL
jgi:acetyltransferase-like isoleucine patch superfamily enzyme